MPETASRNAFLRLTDCGKARFVLPESLFRVVIKPLQHCRKGFSVMRESLFHDTAKPLLWCRTAFSATRFWQCRARKWCFIRHDCLFPDVRHFLNCRPEGFVPFSRFCFADLFCQNFLLPELHIYSFHRAVPAWGQCACAGAPVTFRQCGIHAAGVYELY